MSSSENELAALERNLTKATTEYASADGRYAAAGRERTNALNALNTAQKQLDAYWAKLRQAAPLNSDWGSERARRVAVRDAA